jgi:subtilisin
MRRFAPFVLMAAVSAGCQDAADPLAPERSAPSLAATAGQIVAGQYIVVFKNGVSDVPGLARQLTAAHGGGLQFVYEHALKGFSAQLSAQAAAALQRHPSVAYVEQDQVVYAFGEVPTGVARIFALENGELDIDGSDDSRVDVDVAIIDSGIDLDHPDLNVNVAKSVNCSGGSPMKSSCTSGGDDDNNHGTHVAGTVAALDNGTGVVGVAPGARLWAVKVLRADGSGYMSWIVAGIN